MPGWKGSDRRAFLPKNWSSLRKERFRIDGYQCTHVADGIRCKAVPTDCDHIGHREDHRIEMLRSLCDFHHKTKSGRQGAEALNAKRKEIDSSFRRTEKHPGIL